LRHAKLQKPQERRYYLNATQLIALIGPATEVISWALNQAAILRAQGQLTDEQLAQIKSRASFSDSRWDAAVAKAKAELDND
jgi:hypothetical protein